MQAISMMLATSNPVQHVVCRHTTRCALAIASACQAARWTRCCGACPVHLSRSHHLRATTISPPTWHAAHQLPWRRSLKALTYEGFKLNPEYCEAYRLLLGRSQEVAKSIDSQVFLLLLHPRPRGVVAAGRGRQQVLQQLGLNQDARIAEGGRLLLDVAL